MKTIFFLAAVYLVAVAETITGNEQKSIITGLAITKKIADTTTLNGQWYLLPILASDTATGKIPVLQINLASAMFTGNTGCNAMRGNFQKTDTSLVFDKNIITTKMLCTGYDETTFLHSLLRTNRYKLEKGELILLFDATELSRWTRKPTRQVKLNKA